MTEKFSITFKYTVQAVHRICIEKAEFDSLFNEKQLGPLQGETDCQKLRNWVENHAFDFAHALTFRTNEVEPLEFHFADEFSQRYRTSDEYEEAEPLLLEKLSTLTFEDFFQDAIIDVEPVSNS